MPLFYCEYEILDHTRSDCMTFFGSMTDEDDKKEMGEHITLHGRWSTVGEARGCCIATAKNGQVLTDWLYNWLPMATCTVWPMVDDNDAREIILKQKPTYTVDYSHVGDEPKEDETLFWIKYKFRPEHRMKGHKAFAGMSAKDDAKDAGNNRPLGRWHDLGRGCGVAIAASKSSKDVYQWAYNWAEMCSCEIKPVVTDKQCRAVISGKPDFQKKLTKLMAKMM